MIVTRVGFYEVFFLLLVVTNVITKEPFETVSRKCNHKFSFYDIASNAKLNLLNSWYLQFSSHFFSPFRYVAIFINSPWVAFILEKNQFHFAPPKDIRTFATWSAPGKQLMNAGDSKMVVTIKCSAWNQLERPPTMAVVIRKSTDCYGGRTLGASHIVKFCQGNDRRYYVMQFPTGYGWGKWTCRGSWGIWLMKTKRT